MRHKGLLLAFLAGMASVSFGTAVAQQFGGSMFPDVLPQDYFSEAVNRFARKGIVTGYQTGVFAPNDYVTRGQVAVIVDRYDQQVISKLREQVEQLRSQLGLGRCGDGEVQTGEVCDDGNVVGGDGCSAECLSEVHCSGGYKLGDRYPAPDGCNICTCTEAGIACTERACTQSKCFSSAECPGTEVCSVEFGDCRFPCPPGAVCIQACAGVCVPKTTVSSCGNGVCDEGESGVPGRSGTQFCPDDCPTQSATCGNSACEAGEADEFTLGVDGPALLRRGTCPADCEGGLVGCEQKKKNIDLLFQQNKACETDADCTVFVRGCSPYQTCGKALRQDALLNITTNILQYVEECNSAEPTVCAGCLPQKAICKESVCTLVELVN